MTKGGGDLDVRAKQAALNGSHPSGGGAALGLNPDAFFSMIDFFHWVIASR